MAEGSGAVWTMQVNGNHDDGRPFITAMFTYAGGVGARAAKPGLDACSYPTGVAAVPVEVVEAGGADPLPPQGAAARLRRRRARSRGGLGQTIEFSRRHHAPVAAQRRHQPPGRGPEGIFGGGPGAPRAVQCQRRGRHHTGPDHAAARRRRPPRPARRRRLRRAGGATTRRCARDASLDAADAAGVARRLDATGGRRDGVDPAAELYTSPDVRCDFEREAMFGHEWLCVGRASSDPRARRLVHRHAARRAGRSSPATRTARAARVLGGVPAPGDAGVRRRRQLLDVHLPVPPLDLRARRAAARRAGDGAHARTSTRRTAACRASRSRSGRASSSSTSTRTPPPLGPTLAALRAVPRALRPRRRRLPRHVHAPRPAVELEGHVRELQRRLPRQPPAPVRPGLRPERDERLPRAVGRRLERRSSAPPATPTSTAGSTPPTKAILPVFPALTDEERWRSTFALVPPTLCLGTAPDQCLLLHRAPTGPRDDRRRDRLPVPSHGARATRCSSTCSSCPTPACRCSSSQDQDATTKVQRGLRSGFAAPRPLLVAGGEPRAVQPLARPALPASTGRGGANRPRHRVLSTNRPPSNGGGEHEKEGPTRCAGPAPSWPR